MAAREQVVTEVWRNLDGWPYQVSDLGRVRRSVGGRGTRTGRLLKSRLDTQGYLIVMLCVKSKTKTCRVHRLVSAAFLGPCPEGKEVNHISGDKTHNHIGNLEWVTRSENILHAFRLGLRKRGEERSYAKLNNRKVVEIREKYASGEFTQQELADEYGVTRTAVRHVIEKKSWSHI